jgi:hypothetical protein
MRPAVKNLGSSLTAVSTNGLVYYFSQEDCVGFMNQDGETLIASAAKDGTPWTRHQTNRMNLIPNGKDVPYEVFMEELEKAEAKVLDWYWRKGVEKAACEGVRMMTAMLTKG